jgi:phosphoglycerate dehydrogenase-like enzyme
LAKADGRGERGQENHVTTRIAVIDDWLNVAEKAIDWSRLKARAEVVFFQKNFPAGSEDQAAKLLGSFDAILPMRERSSFSAKMLAHLPRLKMLSLTGHKNPHVDLAAATKAGIVVAQCGSKTPAYAAELTLALMLAAVRRLNLADANMRAGKFQDGVGLGLVLRGRTLGIIGLGRIGTEMAGFARALGMRVLAWSQNLTEEKAQAAGARLVDKETLLSESDIVTLHVVLSERSKGMIGAAELARMKPGAILVNTARGPLIDERALLDALNTGRISAALDVYDEEPLPADHPLRKAPNTVLSPHLGFSTVENFGEFYSGAMDNILAWLDGKPQQVANPEVLKQK